MVENKEMSQQRSGVSPLTFLKRHPLEGTLAIVLVIMIAEVIGGILSNSLALLSDAGHMLVDALALGLSLFAMAIARRPATLSKTYGYHRVEIIAAMANGTTLVLLAAYIFYEAYQRFLEPPLVRAPLMLVVATIGLVANLAGMVLLREESHRSLNIRAAFWHIIGDTVSSVGVIAAGVIIAFTGWRVIDPIVAVLIGVIIVWGAVRLVKESLTILLEAVPEHIHINKVIETIKSVAGVDDVHDIHIWTITSGVYVLSAHLLVRDRAVSKCAEVVEAVNQQLAEHFKITHTTLQFECENCPTGLVCDINQLRDRDRESPTGHTH